MNIVLAAAKFNPYFYVLPVVVAISLVHGASRHDEWKPILSHSLRLGLLVMAILGGATAILLLVNTQT